MIRVMEGIFYGGKLPASGEFKKNEYYFCNQLISLIELQWRRSIQLSITIKLQPPVVIAG